MSVEHVKRIAAVTVTATAVMVFRANDFLVDGVLVASSEIQEDIDLVTPSVEVLEGKLLLRGTFPTGAHVAVTVGSEDFAVEVSQNTSHGSLLYILGLPEEGLVGTPEVLSDGEGAYTSISFLTYTTVPELDPDSGEPVEGPPPVATPVTHAALTNVTAPVIPDDVRTLLTEAMA